MDPFANLLSAAGLERFLRDLLTPVLALGLAAARPLGIALVFPVFTRAELGGVVRAGFALGISLPVIWHATGTLDAVGPDRPAQLVFLALKEVLVGALIGFLFGLPFWTIQAVGELVDTQRGVTNEFAPVDPSTRSQASATSLLLGLSAIALFVAADGLQTLVKTLYDSYAIWPQSQFLPRFSLDSALSAIGALDHLMRFALLVGGPILALLLLIDISAMLIGRSAPNLNAYDLAPMLKNVAFILFMGVYVTYLVGYMRAELASTNNVASQLELFLR